jgi:dTDP-glucose 4,6-dehydratase
MKKKTILITGGAGFIGSHLCDRFIKEGHRVLCLDNFATGEKKNIQHLLKNRNFKFIYHNISKEIFINEPIHYLLHFASPASPIDYMELPIQTLKVGSLGTYHALGLAKAKKARFLLASTSEVYGDPQVHPQTEKYWGHVNPIGPRSVYDEAKRFAEAITMAYHRTHKVDTAIIRIFNTYGPRMRMRDGRAVPNFIYQILKNKPLTIYGTGKQTRSFCYVDDLVEGIVRLLFSHVHTPVNMGNPKEFTILELAKAIQNISGKKKAMIYKSLPQDDPKQRRPDISFAKKNFSWKPTIELEQGLKITFDWFQCQNKLGRQE